MSTSHRRLQRIGMIGFTAGLLVIAVGTAFDGEISGLMRGYGVMLAVAAAYLVVGNRLLGRRRAPAARVAAMGAAAVESR